MTDKQTWKELDEVLGRDLVQVMTDGYGRRYIWMLGYGQRDEARTLGYIWVHFYFCILPLEAFLSDDRLDGALCNKLFNEDARVSLEELDEDDCAFYYSDPDSNPGWNPGPDDLEHYPFFVRSMDIPDGYYIV